MKYKERVIVSLMFAGIFLQIMFIDVIILADVENTSLILVGISILISLFILYSMDGGNEE